MFDVYKKAIINEYAIDQECMRSTHLNQHFKYVLPRIIIWNKNAKKYVFITKVIFFFIHYLFFFLYFIFITYKFVLILISKKPKKEILKFTSNIILCLSPRINEQALFHFNNGFKNTIWVYVPWCKVKKHKNTRQCTILSHLSFFDFFEVYIKSLIAPFIKIEGINTTIDKLQHYVSFDFFMLEKFCHKNLSTAKSIVFCNHYDRWAILFDHISVNHKILIQHGIPTDSSILPIKLNSIKEVYYLNKSSKDFFNEYLTNSNQVIFKLMDISLDLKDISSIFNKKSFSILYVGQNFDQHKEIKIMEEILSKFSNIIILIKPHPSFSNHNYQKFLKKNNDMCFMYTKNDFPSVDLVITHRSTLGLRYEASGINVIWTYNQNINDIIKLIADYMENKLLKDV